MKLPFRVVPVRRPAGIIHIWPGSRLRDGCWRWLGRKFGDRLFEQFCSGPPLHALIRNTFFE